jgi:hypothetical protein
MIAKAAGKLLGIIFHRRLGHAGKNSSVLKEMRQKQDDWSLVSKVSICACPGTVCKSGEMTSNRQPVGPRQDPISAQTTDSDMAIEPHSTGL